MSDLGTATGETFWRAAFEKAIEERAAALAALGRAEERKRALTEALREIAGTATDLPHARRIDRDNMRSIARAALAGSVAAGSGEE